MTANRPLLVSAEWLHENLGSVKVLDCTTHMVPQPVGASRIESGRPDFDRGHIPGAQHVDMVEDLSDPAGKFPYTLPGTDQVGQLLARLDISESDHIVLYTRTPLMVATRAWYVLRTLGHESVSILDGGFDAWVSTGNPVETSDDTTARAFQPHPGHQDVPDGGDARHLVDQRAQQYADKDDVAAALASGSAVVVNALSPEQYAGTGGAHYGRPGRIPGSANVPTSAILTNQGRSFAPVDTIRAEFAGRGVTPDSRVITYCGGGIAATVDAFALELIGHQDWAVYDNSLLEWSTDSACGMESD